MPDKLKDRKYGGTMRVLSASGIMQQNHQLSPGCILLRMRMVWNV